MSATKNIASRLTVLGSGGSGKSSLVVQFVHSHFCETYDPTIEDIYRRQFEVDGKVSVCDILDTAGQDEYTALRSSWFIGSDAFLLVYNMCSKTSFDEVHTFLKQIERSNDGAATPFVVVATHADMAASRVVSTEEGQEFTKQCGPYASYFEVSNKDRINVDESFGECIRLIRRMNGPEETVSEKKKSKKLLKAKCSIL